MNAITPIEAASSADVAFGAPQQPHSVWEARPDWRSTAIRVWKARIVAIYFALLLADGGRLALAGTGAAAHDWTGEAKLLVTALIVIGALVLAAWLTRRTTRYTIDERQVTFRYGIALQATLVIPFGAIEHVGVRVHRDHTGDIALRLKPGPSVIYPKLWPHVRPWRFFRAEPMLRCVPNAGQLGAALCRAITDHKSEYAVS